MTSKEHSKESEDPDYEEDEDQLEEETRREDGGA
jgi:hypothetical protein